MEAIIRPDKDGACLLTARLIAGALRAKPNLALGLATGRTMERVYELLVEMHLKEGLDFSKCRTFNLDEYVGLSGADETSYRFYMNRHLFSKININIANTHLPDGKAENLDTECARYEEKITRTGGIDFQLLGIGQDGHIGFNEPLSALRSRTRVKSLSPDTVRQNAQFFSSPADMPRRAITMGVGTILESRRCVLLATGEAKGAVVARAIEGPITAMISASALQLHPYCTIIIDEMAALKLDKIEYYRWIFENEPEWQEYHQDAGTG